MNIGNQTYWESICTDLSNEFGPEIYETFFQHSKFQSLDDNKFHIIVKNLSTSIVFNNHFKPRIEQIIYASSGHKVDFNALYPTYKDKENSLVKMNNLQSQRWYQQFKPLKDQRFDNFVQGDSNAKALKASQLITNPQSLNINPLFIYGDSGLGKTHLLNAIGNEFLEQNPELKVIYISAHDFVNHYIASLGHISARNQANLTSFTNNFLDADVLLLDDVQSFNSKVETSETFFNIFNHLVNKGKKIIIVADKPPHLLKGIEERLITRFKQGLSVPVLKPGTALARAFLQKYLAKCFKDQQELIITDEVIDLLANNFGSDFRSLSGITNALSLQVIIIPTNKIDLAYLKEHMGHKIEKQTKTSWKDILEYVSEYFQINDYNLITGPGRKKELVLARNCAIWLIRTYTAHNSYKQIGSIFGGRDHSTIMHSYNKITTELKNNESIKTIISDIESKAMLKTK